MKSPALRTLWITLPALVLVALAAWIIPAMGQREFMERPPVGVEQAEQLTAIALDSIHTGNYKDAIHALHSAAFILEEGLGMHMPGMGMHPMRVGPPFELHHERGPMLMEAPLPGEFQHALERTWRHVHELQEIGVDLGDIPARLEEAERAFNEDRIDEAREILRAVHEDLRRIQGEHREGQRERSEE